ncbi:GntR family transcriptional regulator [Acidisphaera sp. L21]|uniref:GntR family transcriptional regulator n=1 Tax=Acidisphaera sp. L21 TaxID=1641851 RepID=UPI00131C3A36|nr:GntR family transcriptional regulator [Acidisphaera sp. L21]
MARLDNLAKMAPRATGQQVYEDLHGQIVRGELTPGQALSETKVAEHYGLSRTPVREVFWRLGEDGFIRVIPQVGTFVAPINIPAVYDSQFVRETLECRAVADAARAATDPAIGVLRTLLADQTAAMKSRNFATFFALDEAMHRTLMTIAGRPFVWQVITGAKAQLDRVRFLSLGDEEWPSMIMDQHRGIVDCVAAHDPAGAVRIMTAHLRTAFAAIGRIATAHEDFFEGSGTHSDEPE